MATETSPDWVHLGNGEDVVWESRPHPVAMGRRLLVGAALVLVGVPLLVWGVTEGRTILTAAGIVLAVAGTGLLAVLYLFWTHTRYVITSSELYEKRGVVTHDVTQFRLNRVQNTTLRQSALGRLLGYGDLTVYTAGSGDPELTFERLPRPHRASIILSEQLDGVDATRTTP
ncbi:PH domain-containing protein [Natrialbaceae archaeon AArc-T1-2]|uniref:PH domain-containing protein n=1 Tax=Natrialbaceae archaeon AArc-T1-2 TaxID=3053904 RepID=UPI00255AE4ED|nr:PH domain-containing protein [Natrialbaceae archaeon AArc-T1-2]WIV68324.1 PH domain-containing protein [Natrialbaceae archaeon AArc-T1-2]